jgi:Transglutaminase-like superfamily/Coenzyme PQQ synthesis protein D (PqqD)
MSARAVAPDKEDAPRKRTFLPSRDVFTAHLEGELLVLDLRTQAYYVFDHVATAMWQALIELGDRERVLERLHRLYDADTRRLADDLDALVARLIASGFAGWSAAPPNGAGDEPAFARPPRVRNVSAVRAWWWLARTVLHLRRDGVAGAFRRSKALTGVDAVPVDMREELVERAVRAFARAENLFVMRKAPRDCFPRSIALFCFLRQLGVPVEHRVGVERFPFRAHAWVEYDGRVLSDHDGNRRAFTTIARIAG